MSIKVLEQTISELQRRVAEIEAQMSKPSDGWKKIVGAAKDDNHFTWRDRTRRITGNIAHRRDNRFGRLRCDRKQDSKQAEKCSQSGDLH